MKSVYLIASTFLVAISATFLVLLISCHPEVKKQDNLNKSAFELLKQSENCGSVKEASDIASKAGQFVRKAQSDSLVAECMINLGNRLSLLGNTQMSLSYYEKANQLSTFISYQKGICRSLLGIAKIHNSLSEYDAAMQNYSSVLKIAEKYHLKEIEADAYNLMGKYYHNIGNQSKSLSCYLDAFKVSQLCEDTLQRINILFNIGKTYVNNGEYYLALKYYLEADNLAEKSNNLASKAEVCNLLGSMYLLLGYSDKSLDFHRKALSLQVLLNKPREIAKSFNDIGETLLEIGKTDSATLYFQKSLEKCLLLKYDKGTVEALINLGKTNTSEGKYNTALSYLTRANLLAIKSNYSEGQIVSCLAMGNANVRLGESGKASTNYKKSLATAISSNNSEFWAEIFDGLYKSYLGLGNYKQAIFYQNKYFEEEKKILLAKTNLQLDAIKINFELQSKVKDNHVLRKENELKELAIKHENALMWIFIIVCVFSLVFSISYYARFKQKKKANNALQTLNNKIVYQNSALEKLNIELEAANHEKDKILSIISHELRNPIFWFQNLIEILSQQHHLMPPEYIKKSLAVLDESAKNAFHLMDNLLQWSRSKLNKISPSPKKISIESLINEPIRLYDSILKQKNIHLSVQIEKNAEVYYDPDLFSFVIRNLLSNSIKYTPDGGVIIISCKSTKKAYEILLSDTGIGMSPEALKIIFSDDQISTALGLMQEKGSGFGLKLCKEFVEANGGSIWIESNQGNGTHVYFTVPKKSAEKLVKPPVLLQERE